MLKSCVFLAYNGEDACQAVIDKALDNIDTLIKPNFRMILQKLNEKMADGSVVVWNGYAKFFNTDDEETCTKQQAWNWAKWWPQYWFKSALPLTIARRKAFNSLVDKINSAILDVVEETNKAGKMKYKVGFSDWDPWVYDGVDGQYCDPQGYGFYPDPDQPQLQFFKPNTYNPPKFNLLLLLTQLLGRDVEDLQDPTLSAEHDPTSEEADMLMKRWYDSTLWKSSNPGYEALFNVS